MTDDSDDILVPTPPAPAADDASTANGERATKAFWVSMGIGSAALAAALLYAKRPKAKRRS